MGGGLTIGVRVGVAVGAHVGGIGSEVAFGSTMIGEGAIVRGEIGGGTVPIAGRSAGCMLARAIGGGTVPIVGRALTIGGLITARGAVGTLAIAIGGGTVPIAVRGVTVAIAGETVPIAVHGAGTIPIAGCDIGAGGFAYRRTAAVASYARAANLRNAAVVTVEILRLSVATNLQTATNGFRTVVDRRATGTVRGAGATTNPPLSSSFLSTDVIEDGDVACS